MQPDFFSKLEDFWHRREAAPQFSREFWVNGCRVEMISNHAGVLDAGELAARQYSVAPPRPGGYRLQIAIHPPPVDPGPPPENLFPLIHYTASGDWFNLQLGTWGNCFSDLRAGFGVAILAPSLAARPDWVARHLLNTLFTNYLTRNGFAMLHATGLVRNIDRSLRLRKASEVRKTNSAQTATRVLLLMAPHNSGKSTTALRLTLSRKFRLLTDSMVYLSETPGGLQMTGFPVGRGKLRRDMLPHFPELVPLLTPEQVRDETKFVLDLHQLDSALVYDEAVWPDQIDLCLLKRNGQPKTFIQEATLEETWEAITQNSLHYDTPEVWAENLRLIEPLVNRARLFHLEIGTEGNGIVERILGIEDD